MRHISKQGHVSYNKKLFLARKYLFQEKHSNYETTFLNQDTDSNRKDEKIFLSWVNFLVLRKIPDLKICFSNQENISQ